MRNLEYWVRIIRLPFMLAFPIAAYLAVLSVTTGWRHNFLYGIFWPFILATILFELIELNKVLKGKR